jgi:hypothetical protein
MIEDDTTDIDPEDRAHMAGWAALDKTKEYAIRQPKQVISAALWVGSGMVASQKPAIIRGGNEKTFPEDNWFFQIVHHHDIDSDELERGDDTELYRKPVVSTPAPVKRPSQSGPTATPTSPPSTVPAMRKPAGKVVQRDLFGDEV